MSNERESKGKRREPVLLGAVLARAEAASARAAGSALAPALWRQVVGERIATRTRPGKLERGLLTINVASSVWAQELSLLSTDLLARLQAQGVLVTGLRFRVENFSDAGQAPAPPTQAEPAEPLPRALQESLERIEDEDLRRSVSEAAALLFPTAKR